VEQAFDEFSDAYGHKFSGTERYWEQAVVLPELAMRLAYDWGILPYNPRNVIHWVLTQMTSMRDAYSEVTMTPMERLVEYFNTFANATARVYHMPRNGAVVDLDTLPRNDLRIRLDLYKNSSGVVERGEAVIDKLHLKHWLAEQGVNISELLAELRAHRLDTTPKTGNGSISRYTPLARGQVRVLCVNLLHPTLVDMLGSDAGGARVEAVRKNLRVVGQ